MLAPSAGHGVIERLLELVLGQRDFVARHPDDVIVDLTKAIIKGLDVHVPWLVR